MRKTPAIVAGIVALVLLVAIAWPLGSYIARAKEAERARIAAAEAERAEAERAAVEADARAAREAAAAAETARL
ncbi:MAG: hypothetical protein RI990_1229, partial [Planctomycetota bacterium]